MMVVCVLVGSTYGCVGGGGGGVDGGGCDDGGGDGDER